MIAPQTAPATRQARSRSPRSSSSVKTGTNGAAERGVGDERAQQVRDLVGDDERRVGGGGAEHGRRSGSRAGAPPRATAPWPPAKTIVDARMRRRSCGCVVLRVWFGASSSTGTRVSQARLRRSMRCAGPFPCSELCYDAAVRPRTRSCAPVACSVFTPRKAQPNMANIKQQKKRILTAQRQRTENLRYRSTIKTLFNRLQLNVDTGDKESRRQDAQGARVAARPCDHAAARCIATRPRARRHARRACCCRRPRRTRRRSARQRRSGVRSQEAKKPGRQEGATQTDEAKAEEPAAEDARRRGAAQRRGRGTRSRGDAAAAEEAAAPEAEASPRRPPPRTAADEDTADARVSMIPKGATGRSRPHASSPTPQVLRRCRAADAAADGDATVDRRSGSNVHSAEGRGTAGRSARGRRKGTTPGRSRA